jgi:flavin reductase (DIM6/NTAB) family NADH-FMN oxidoreductase RutF
MKQALKPIKDSDIDMPDPHDPMALRKALGKFATGIAIVTTEAENGKREGLTINSFSSVSLDPPLVLWSLKRDAPSIQTFIDSGKFIINILSANQSDLSGHFARPQVDKFAGIEHTPGANGCPQFPGCLAQFECETFDVLDGGDHAIFLGRVQKFAENNGMPLIYSEGKYCHILPVDQAAN